MFNSTLEIVYFTFTVMNKAWHWVLLLAIIFHPVCMGSEVLVHQGHRIWYKKKVNSLLVLWIVNTRSSIIRVFLLKKGYDVRVVVHTLYALWFDLGAILSCLSILTCASANMLYIRKPSVSPADHLYIATMLLWATTLQIKRNFCTFDPWNCRHTHIY